MRQATQAEQGANGWIFARSNYRYDELNRLRGAWRDEQSNKGEGYKYDRIGQLTNVVYNADNVSTGNPANWASWSRKVIYNVDPLNRLSVNENGTLTSYTPDPMNQYTGISGQGLAYDANFNLSYLNGGSVYYDAEKRVTSITIGGATVAQFVYDGLGRCLKRTLDGVPTLIAYHGWKPFIEWDNAGNMIAYNIYGAGPDEILTRWQTGVGHLHYHLDRLGNVQFLLSEGNAGLERYTYDAFGDPTVTNWDGTGGRNFSNYGNRFMFTGREYFPSLALYDYRNRFYRPNLGRFLQSDPIGFAGGDTNLFRYCGGDPVNAIDPSGLRQDDSRPVRSVTGDHIVVTGAALTGPGSSLTSAGGGEWQPLGLGGLGFLFSGRPGGAGNNGGEFFVPPGTHRVQFTSVSPNGKINRNPSGTNIGIYPTGPGEATTDPIVALLSPEPGQYTITSFAQLRPGDQLLRGGFGLADDPNNAFRQLVRLNNANPAAARSRIQFANAMNQYALLVAKGMTIPAVLPAAKLTAGYLGIAYSTRNFNEVGDFASELGGVPSGMPTNFGGTLGFGWRKYGELMLEDW